MAGTKKTTSAPNGTKRAPAKTLAEAKPKQVAARNITMHKVVRGQAGVDRQAIAQRAYELFQRRGCAHGHHEQDWLQAEYELCAATEHPL